MDIPIQVDAQNVILVFVAVCLLKRCAMSLKVTVPNQRSATSHTCTSYSWNSRALCKQIHFVML